MRTVEGTLEGYGPYVADGVLNAFEYIRIRDASGRIHNIQNALAFTNVTSELPHALGQEIKLYYKPNSNVILMMEGDGQIVSDVPANAMQWQVMGALAVGPFIISLILIYGVSGGGVIAGILLGMLGLAIFLKAGPAAIKHWPDKQATKLHDEAVADGRVIST